MQFSIIIPAYNTEKFIEACLHSVLNQSLSSQYFEVIVVDDCSKDSTLHIVSRLALKHKNLIVTQTSRNSGPGIARNLGLSKASGKWVLFVDGDDYLDCEALNTLNTFINRHEPEDLDAVGFNWKYAAQCLSQGYHAQGRRDYDLLDSDKRKIIKRYLSLRMDGSVIYTAVRRRLITDNNLKFAPGYHEDVDFIFKVYRHARKVRYLNEVLYFKRWRDNSIVGTISSQHIRGFMRAWKEIGDFIKENSPDELHELIPYYKKGLVGVVATRVREIYRYSSSNEEAVELYNILYRCFIDMGSYSDVSFNRSFKTKYSLIAQNYIETMKDDNLDNIAKADAIKLYMANVIAKTWSCTDLHYSLFLAPNQIRTCCKRFFIDGEMRGDVALLDTSNSGKDRFSCRNILKAKQTLLDKINSGETTACDGCPFLEFKEWGPLTSLDIKYLSLEYHSVCNLRCLYCSSTYYGGMQPQYDVKAILDELVREGAFTNCSVVVWGGGEPALDDRFVTLIEYVDSMLPHAHQRVFTNSVVFSPIIQQLLSKGKLSVITSIDAGTDATFTLVRGRPKLRDVLTNVEKYAAANPGNVTIKYVFTEENSSLNEVMAFCSLLRDRSVAGCNIQISYDFKKEKISVDTVISMVAMHAMLSDAGFHVIYFDDLLRQRLTEIHSDAEHVIEAKLAEMKLGHALANKVAYKEVAIWGAGWQAKYLLEKSSFFKHVNVAFLVDDTPSKIGGNFLGHNIYSPSVLLDSNIPVVIAAVQGFPTIYKSFMRLGIDKARLVTGLIL